ncbi:hypothetical protein CCP3SC15_1560007 [Gammaproteobacteria bacterium]
MYEDHRTIQPSGLLSQAGAKSYIPKPININMPNATKPAPGTINPDKEKQYQQNIQQQQLAQQNAANAKSGGSVICTELKRLGIMSAELYEYAHLSRPVHPIILNGYHLWAVPYVEAMRKWRLPRVIAAPLAMAWATQRAHKMAPAKFAKGSLLGSVVHVVGGSLCFAIGLFILGRIDWKVLYTGRNDGYPWPTR